MLQNKKVLHALKNTIIIALKSAKSTKHVKSQLPVMSAEQSIVVERGYVVFGATLKPLL
jgi:hypothetical protein